MPQTSGSTGNPKSFTLTDAQLDARIEQLQYARPPGFMDVKSLYCDIAKGSTAYLRYEKWIEDKGGTIYGPLATFELTAKQIVDNKIEAVQGSAVSLVRYANLVAGAHKPKFVLIGGTGLSAEQSKIIQAGLGSNVWNLYSVSEVGTIAFASAAQSEEYPGCVGKVCQNVEVKIVDNEILVKTTAMIDGYSDPKLTEKFFVDGWFRTGDKGYMQGDLLILEGRIK